MNRVAIGIDVSKLKMDVVIYREGKYKSKVFSNNQLGFEALLPWLKAQGVENFHACLESTGIYGEALSYYLHDNGCYISVVNPAQIKAFGQSELIRNKTDQLDAKLIARFCATMDPAQWNPPSKEIRELRSLIKRLEELQKMFLQEHNHLESARHKVIETSIKDIMLKLQEEIKLIKAKIKGYIDNDPTLKNQKTLLDSIPGIGDSTIALLLSFMCTPERFDSAKKLAAYAGLNPKNRQSGSSLKGGTSISKTGDSRLRKALYMPALVAIKHNPTLKAFYDRLIAANKSKKSAIVAVMRKLLHIIYGVLKSGKAFDVNFVSVC